MALSILLFGCKVDTQNYNTDPLHLPIKKQGSSDSESRVSIVFESPADKSILSLEQNSNLTIGEPKGADLQIADYKFTIDINKSHLHQVEKMEVIETVSQLKTDTVCSAEKCQIDLHEALEEITCRNGQVFIAPNPTLQFKLHLQIKESTCEDWSFHFANICDEVLGVNSNSGARDVASTADDTLSRSICILLLFFLIIMGILYINKITRAKK